MATDGGQERSAQGVVVGRQRRVLRSTVPLFVRVSPAVRARAKEQARRLGVPLSTYMEALIGGRGRPASASPAGDATSVALAGNRCATLLAEITAKLREGEPVETLLSEVRAVRDLLTEALLSTRADYDARLDSLPLVSDDWHNGERGARSV